MDKKKIQELVIVGLAMLVIGLIAGRAAAVELNQAGPAQVIGAGAKGQLYFNSNTPGSIPTALMIYSGDGAAFWVRRNTPGSSTLETVPLKVPANASLIIPVGGWQVKRAQITDAFVDTFRVKIFVNATSVTDSVFAIPMYR